MYRTEQEGLLPAQLAPTWQAEEGLEAVQIRPWSSSRLPSMFWKHRSVRRALGRKSPARCQKLHESLHGLFLKPLPGQGCFQECHRHCQNFLTGCSQSSQGLQFCYLKLQACLCHCSRVKTASIRGEPKFLQIKPMARQNMSKFKNNRFQT